jgi:hypothetical protein
MVNGSLCVCGKKMFVVCITNPTHLSHITFKMDFRHLTSADRDMFIFSKGGSRRGGRITRRSRRGGRDPLYFGAHARVGVTGAAAGAAGGSRRSRRSRGGNKVKWF